MKLKQKKKIKKFTGLLSMILAAATVQQTVVFAQNAEKDWGEYKIENDGYGYLTANFPDKFTSEYIIIENDVSTTQKVEALMLTLTEDEKKDLLEADGYWKGIPRVGIPEIVFYQQEDGNETPAPGIASAQASFDETSAQVYGTAAAAAVKASGANAVLLESTDDGNTENDFLQETMEDNVKSSLEQNGVITGISKKFCTQTPEDMSSEEIEEAAADILYQIGKAGYLGMVQISRDGLAAIDSDAPDVIALNLDTQTDTEAEITSAISGAVLLKNENGILPLKKIPEFNVTSSDTMMEFTADDAAIFYVSAAGDTLSQEQQEFLTKQISAAKSEEKKIVLVLATAQAVNIDQWTEDCDAIIEVWQSIEEESSVLTSILSGTESPGGRLFAPWPTENIQEWSTGYGLSYTEFSYELISSELSAQEEEDYGVDVTVQVTNSGKMAGADIVQLYLDSEKGINLAAMEKTSILQAGESEQLTIHISQRGLSVWDGSEWKIQEGKRNLFLSHSSSDTSLSQEIEISAARAGASVQAEAPDSVSANEVFNVTVSTPIDVISLQMTDEQGNIYQPVDVLKENLGESITFTYSLQIAQTGKATIDIYTVTAEGTSEEPAAQLELEVK